jgi:hypothetical protein
LKTHALSLTMSRNEVTEMIAAIEPINSGFCLTDPRDPRYQYMTSLRHRFGEFLHKASVSLRQQGEENTVDAVHMLVSPLDLLIVLLANGTNPSSGPSAHTCSNTEIAETPISSTNPNTNPSWLWLVGTHTRKSGPELSMFAEQGRKYTLPLPSFIQGFG